MSSNLSNKVSLRALGYITSQKRAFVGTNDFSFLFCFPAGAKPNSGTPGTSGTKIIMKKTLGNEPNGHVPFRQ